MQKPEGIERCAYSVANFGRAFSVGRSTIYEEIRAGRLKVRKVGARTIITYEDAMAWLHALPSRSAAASMR
jgi:excisionase family DNA binding protein